MHLNPWTLQKYWYIFKSLIVFDFDCHAWIRADQPHRSATSVCPLPCLDWSRSATLECPVQCHEQVAIFVFIHPHHHAHMFTALWSLPLAHCLIAFTTASTPALKKLQANHHTFHPQDSYHPLPPTNIALLTTGARFQQMNCIISSHINPNTLLLFLFQFFFTSCFRQWWST